MKKKYPIYTIFLGFAIIFFIIVGVRMYDMYTGNSEDSGSIPGWLPPLILGFSMLTYAWLMKKKADKEKDLE
ncbi:MAG: hypothetical protein AAF694_25415 [Bacteroidota bacterium]